MCIPVPLLWYIYNTQSLIGITFFIVNIFIGIQQLLYPTTKCGWGAIMDSLCHVRPSIRRSVGRSVRHHYRVCSINPIPIGGFSSNLAEMFTSTRRCAKAMLLMGQLKVKVTIEGQISNNQILDIMLCSLCKSYTNWKIFFNLGSNVQLNKGICRTHVTLLPA